MKTSIRPLRCFLTTATAFVVLLAASSSPAQDNGKDEDEPDDPAVAVPQPQFLIADENFDQWVFGNVRNAEGGRERFNAHLQIRVKELERSCAITDAQKQKLLLAGRGDVFRFMDRVEDKRRRFQLVKTDQNKFQAFFQEIQPLQQTLQTGLFSDDSLFMKTIRTTLDPSQVAAHEKGLRDRRLFRYRAKIELAVTTLDNAVGLTADQRRRLVALLAERDQAPKKFGSNDQQVVMLQLAKLPESKVKPIFNEAQWKVVAPQLKQAKAMENYFSQQGFLPEPLDGDPKPDPSKEPETP